MFIVHVSNEVTELFFKYKNVSSYEEIAVHIIFTTIHSTCNPTFFDVHAFFGGIFYTHYIQELHTHNLCSGNKNSAVKHVTCYKALILFTP